MPLHIPLTPATRDTFSKAIDGIDENTPRQWGELTPARMLAHLIFTVELSLGMHTRTADLSTPITRTRFFRWFMFRIMPWPKGRIKAPEEFTPETAEAVEQLRNQLKARVDEFVTALESTPDRVTRSPLVGPITLRDWAHIHGRHTEWHLRQFGVW